MKSSSVGGEGVGEIGEGAHEVSAAAGWRADSEEHRGLPELFGADDGDLGEVVRAHEEGIVVKDLRSGGLVVGVVEADESVAKEGSELSAGCFELGLVTGSLDDLGEVGLDLKLLVVGGVDARRPVDLFAVGEDGAGHLELAEFAGEGEQLIVGGFALLHVGEAVAEGEEGVEGDEVLVFENGANSCGRVPDGRAGLRECPGGGPARRSTI